MLLRSFITICTLSFLFLAKGQQLPKGTFTHSSGFTFRQITFKQDNKFGYRYANCIGGDSGTGTYSIKGNSLLLTFEDTFATKIINKPDLEYEDATTDSTSVTFHFIDLQNSIPVGSVRTKFENQKSKISYIKFSNNLGLINLKIANSDLPVDIEISCVGSKTSVITIDKTGNYSFKYPISFDFIQPLPKDFKMVFFIDDYDETELLLKDEKSDKKSKSYLRTK